MNFSKKKIQFHWNKFFPAATQDNSDSNNHDYSEKKHEINIIIFSCFEKPNNTSQSDN